MSNPVILANEFYNHLNKDKKENGALTINIIEEAIISFGGQITYEQLDIGCDGKIEAIVDISIPKEPKIDSFSIIINNFYKDDEANRKRLLAHELSHLLLHLDIPSEAKSTENNKITLKFEDSIMSRGTNLEKEVEADLFAEHFILPNNILKLLLSERKYIKDGGFIDFDNMSKEEKIHKNSLRARAIKLGYVK